MFHAVVSGDSLIGFAEVESLTRFAIAVTEVKKLEKWELKRAVRHVRNYYIFVGTVGGLALLWATWGWL